MNTLTAHLCQVDETATASITRSQRRLVYKVLRGFMANLRAILARRRPEILKAFPRHRRPCHTCAFNPATDRMKGAYTTAQRLHEAIQKNEPFYCHANMPYMKGFGWIPVPKDKLRLCANWAMIMADPETKTAFERAALEQYKPKPAPQ